MALTKIVTFNIRNAWDTDGINSFMHRAGFIYDKITAEMPDIIGFQECTPKIMGFMERVFPEYMFCGQYRSKNYWGEGLFVAVRKDSWRVLGYESFWISDTPYVAGSRFPLQSDCPRICNVVQIRNKESGAMLRIFNLHLDHVEEEARVLGMKCVLNKIAEFNEKLYLPTVILGDFNSYPYSKTIETCNTSSLGFFDLTSNIIHSNHAFLGEQAELSKIDYIYVTEELKNAFNGVRVWDDSHEGIYLSDHYPICAEFEI